ncbi:MAG: CotH kinase family protein [Bacteroidales bacterium]|nr:CotH kinase family protein [Bacteroidales bacterium]
MNTIKSALISIPVIVVSMMISCNKVDVPTEEVPDDEIIDSLVQNEVKEEVIVSIPHSIVILNQDITLKNGYFVDIEFRVNPSDAELDLRLFKLDNIDAHTKGVGYINTPTHVRLRSIKKSRNSSDSPYRGQYTMKIEDLGLSENFKQTLALVYAAKDSEGNPIEVSSDPFTVSSAPVSSLAKVYVTTPDGAGITSKTEWISDSHIRIVGEDGIESLNMSTSIRGRGNSTWDYPKKPYALKLDSKAEVLGMPKHKRWVLLANWMDRTLLRNDVSFEMGRRIMDWAPRGEFVELYLNDRYQGNYYLCEQIKPDRNRVDIDEENGGYILEFDTYGPYDEINYFYTPVQGYPVTIKEPDEEIITSWEHEGFLYISDHLGEFEQMLEDDKEDLSRWNEIESLIDVTSYIDWWLIHELSYNWEPHHPKSCYMHKKESDKLFAGPIWDFDHGTFADAEGLICNEVLWYGYLFRYPEFTAAIKVRWAEVKEVLEGIDSYIETQAEYIRESNDVNIYKWPTTADTNKDEHLSFDGAISVMRKSYQLRLKVVDEYISKL